VMFSNSAGAVGRPLWQLLTSHFNLKVSWNIELKYCSVLIM